MKWIRQAWETFVYEYHRYLVSHHMKRHRQEMAQTWGTSEK